MKDKKQIDKLFRDRFKDFEAAPPPEAWDNIKARLQKKKEDRKIIPIWWKVAGVAALLALLLTIGNSIFNQGSEGTEITDRDNQVENTSDPENTTKDDIITDNKLKDAQVASENEDEESTEKVENDSDVYSGNKSGDAILDADESIKSAVTTEDTDSKIRKEQSEKDPIIRDKKIVVDPQVKDAVVKDNSEENNRIKDNQDLIKKDPGKILDKTGEEKEGVAKTEIDNKKSTTDPLIKKEGAVKDTNTEEAVAKEEAQEQKEDQEEKKSIFDAIEENKEVEEAVAQKEGPKNRWEVSPNVGPVYYSSFGNGSSIDPTFADNSQSGDVNLSYGADVSYAISDRLSLRTGIHNVNVSYSTGDVELGAGPVSAALQSVNYGRSTGDVITALDKGTIQPSPEGGFGNIRPKAAGAEAFINQSIRYYEIPMELKYALIDSKFGIHMIGGFSTLFLGDNEISVEAGDFRSVLGEANNLNSLSFTTNVGLGFDYKISRRLKFNIEPIFKYQLNPYSDSSVDFNPFYMGVYTGLSFKF